MYRNINAVTVVIDQPRRATSVLSAERGWTRMRKLNADELREILAEIRGSIYEIFKEKKKEDADEEQKDIRKDVRGVR